MKIERKREGGTLVIALAEELGHHEASRIIDEAERVAALDPGGPVVLDLSALTFMDSSGLAVVLHLQRAMQRAGRGFSVRGARGQAMRVFQAAGLPKIVSFEGE